MSKELDEALKCLETIIDNSDFYDDCSYRFDKEFTIIKQFLLKAQEQEKLLDILKSKQYIPFDRLNPRFWNDKETYDEVVNYEYYLWLCENECEYVVKEERKLTREEFDIIMEMLNND